MCSKLPVVDPKRLRVPTLIMRGQYDGIASFDDLLAFFAQLPNPDKQFSVMPGIAHSSFQEKNHLVAYEILLAFFSRPEPSYTG
jgi:pimeloyl-ACP methyl ester carboxylesterase